MMARRQTRSDVFAAESVILGLAIHALLSGSSLGVVYAFYSNGAGTKISRSLIPCSTHSLHTRP